MSMSSKSPKAVAAAAYEAGRKALPKYAHKLGRKANAKLVEDALFRKLLMQTLQQFYRYPKHESIDDDDQA